MDTKEILGYAAGSIGSAVLAVIILPLLSWYFPADDIGRIVLMQTAAGLTVSVLCLGLDQAYVREYYAAADKDTLFKTLFLPPCCFPARPCRLKSCFRSTMPPPASGWCCLN